jgi:predicted PurR-regulated permease PerM
VEQERLDGLFAAHFGKREAARIRGALAHVSVADLAGHVVHLSPLERDETLELLRGMLEIGYADGDLSTSERTLIEDTATSLGLDGASFDQCRQLVIDEQGQRSALVKSSAGILVALVVLAVFVFTATFLKSVLFGLVLAYFVLPLQRFFQYRVLPHPWSEAVLALVARVALPFQRLRRASTKSVASVAADAHARRVTQACNATFATLAASAVLLLLSMGWVSSRYVAALRPAEASVAAPPPAPVVAKTGELSPTNLPPTNLPPTNLPPTNLPPTNLPLATPAAVATTEADELNPLVARLESYRPILERSQWLRFSSELAREYLSDDAKKKELLGMVASNLQPVLLRVGGLLGALANLLLDSLMTLFFFSFFLKRIAADQAPDRGRSRPTSRYLVETIFSSGWLPSAGAEAIREAHVILDEVLSMLQTWVKGYLWIVIIESTVYITAFALLGIPYFHVLGLLAGMTVLLPFIGPIASLLLTLVVAFAFQGPSVTMFLLIAGVYFFANVILEQLVLFPTLVGEALGLNSLETIIVVLLGGLVAGLAGAVFSIPVAAILKYLVPHIYQTLSQRRAPTAALAGDSAAGVMADEQEIGERP